MCLLFPVLCTFMHLQNQYARIELEVHPTQPASQRALHMKLFVSAVTLRWQRVQEHLPVICGMLGIHRGG